MLWKVQRVHDKDGKRYIDYEAEERTFAKAWERAKQFSEDYEALEGDLIVLTAPDGSSVGVAWYTDNRWLTF